MSSNVNKSLARAKNQYQRKSFRKKMGFGQRKLTNPSQLSDEALLRSYAHTFTLADGSPTHRRLCAAEMRRRGLPIEPPNLTCPGKARRPVGED